jgi:16S rRNA (guanine527-N7)-methyltransferase
VKHSLAFADVVGDAPSSALDLGSGGGIPGLVLAWRWPETRLVLMDGSARRTAFLAGSVGVLGWQSRVEVICARAEVLGRDSAWREQLPLVVVRGFGLPAVTAECAAPLVAVGGRVVVSEPPEPGPDRWPSALSLLGLVAGERRRVGGFTFQSLRKLSACPDRYPRRTGIPGKRPLFGEKGTFHVKRGPTPPPS